jgi:hypothetical protein
VAGWKSWIEQESSSFIGITIGLMVGTMIYVWFLISIKTFIRCPYVQTKTIIKPINLNMELYMKCSTGTKGMMIMIIVLLCNIVQMVVAEGTTSFLPLAKYDYLSLSDQQINSVGGGLVITSDNLFVAGIYTHHSLGQIPESVYPEVYQSVELLVDGKTSRHGYLALFQSISDQPVYGGLQTYQGALAYSYEVFGTDRLTLDLGLGMAVGDFGIELKNGNTLPILPVPLIRMAYTSRVVDFKFELITGPSLNFILAPGSRFRILGDFRMDQFSDLQDLIFECALEYRLFPADHVLSGLAGFSVGVESNKLSFVPAAQNENLDVHYYGVFGQLDLSLLKLNGGYAFNSTQIVREDAILESGNGFFISIQAVLPL